MLILPARLRPFAPGAALAVALLLPVAGYGEDFCQRIAPDPEFPAGLAGQYNVIGKRPVSGVLYAATLTVDLNKQGYALRLAEGGQTTRGEAWLVRCGPDKSLALMTRYGDREGFCSLGHDGDNYFRIGCLTRQRNGKADGLESWFQTP